MTRKVTATEAKAKLLELLRDVENGDEIEITRRGATVARLVGSHTPAALKGRFAGLVTSTASDEELFSTGVEWNAS